MRPSYTSQPGISKSIIELEDELGVEIFTRHGKRLSAITDQGKLVVAAAERILREVEALKRRRADYMDDDQGELIIAATHTYARDLLPNAIARFRARFPKVVVSILQGSASQVQEMLRSAEADVVHTLAELLCPMSSREHVEQAMRNAEATVTGLAANNVTALRHPLRPAPAPGRKNPAYSAIAIAP